MWKLNLLFLIGVVTLQEGLGDMQEHAVCQAPKRKDAHPLYCDQYYLCLPSAPLMKTCLSDTLYDEKRQTCLSKRRTKCTPGKILSTDAKKNLFGSCKRVICSYSGYSFQPESIDPLLCSHIHFLRYGYLNEKGLHLVSPDVNQTAKELVEMKKGHPHLKLMVTLQPIWKMSYEKLAAVKELRDFFLKSAAKVVREMQFDGLIIIWWLPHWKGNLYSELLKQTMIFLQAEAHASNLPRLLLSHHVGARRYLSYNHYNIATLHPHIDYTVIMASNMAGGWHSVIGHHSLLSEVGDVIDIWISKGYPRDKLVIGIPTFGRSFKLKDVSQTNLGAPAAGHGKLILPGVALYGAPPFTRICQLLSTGKATVVHSTVAAAPYLYYKDFWLGYEDADSVFYKTRYVIDRNLGGIYINDLENDDFAGQYCGLGVFPLLSSALDACRM
ncbi:unnamed protein product [Lymnaea stagnalis]|uniref:Chitinase n=1 Tax=Lymnaea stagnalis TaxID=6523 RepID=A0AAV2H5Z5_LYMST